MKIRTERLPSPYRTFYVSEIRPEITWADTTRKGRPWSVVATNKSKVWGSMGMQRMQGGEGDR
jgi:hypothetical protein